MPKFYIKENTFSLRFLKIEQSGVSVNKPFDFRIVEKTISLGFKL